MNSAPISPRILVADDDAISLGLISEILGGDGAIVTTVPDGRAAVEKAMIEPFDIVILDIEMPVLDGIQACRQLRQMGFTREIPILMLTGRTDKESIENSFAAGADDFLNKPVHAALLWRRVCNLLQLKELKKHSENLTDVLELSKDSDVV